MSVYQARTKNGYNFIFLIIILSMSCISTLVSIARIENAPDGFKPMFVLPLLYGFLFLSTDVNKAMFRYPGITVLNLILAVRYTILPFYFSLSGIYYHSNAVSTQPDENMLAIILMIYDMFCIMFTLHFLIQRLEKKRALSKEYNSEESSLYHSDQSFIYYIAIGIGVISFLIFPAIRERLNFILSRVLVNYTNLNLIETLCFLFTSNIQNLLFILVINRQYKNVTTQSKINYLSILLFAIINIATFWSSNRLTIVAQCISVILLIRALLPIKKKYFVNIVLGSLMTIIIISMSQSRWFGSGELSGFRDSMLSKFDLTQTANYLQAYFGGPHLISTAIATKTEFSTSIGLDTLLHEISSSMLFIRQIPLFNSISTTIFFNYKFGFKAFTSMILPTLGQSYLFFGIIGAPILSILFCFILYFVEKRAMLQRNIGEKYAYYVLLIWLGFFPMQNLNIITSTIFNKFLPLYLIIYANKKITLHKEARSRKALVNSGCDSREEHIL